MSWYRAGSRQLDAMKALRTPEKFGMRASSKELSSTKRERSPPNDVAVEETRAPFPASPMRNPALEIRSPTNQVCSLQEKYKKSTLPPLGLNRSLFYTQARLVCSVTPSAGQVVSPSRTPQKAAQQLPIRPVVADAAITHRWLGIRNLGNTCFAASIFQFLSTCDAFWRELNAQASSERPLHAACLQLIESLRRGATDPAERRLFTEIPRPVQQCMPLFFNGRQHDAHEFLIELFTQLELEAGAPWPLGIFGAKTAVELHCVACGASNSVSEPLCFLSLACESGMPHDTSVAAAVAQLNREEIIGSCTCDKCNLRDVDMRRTTKLLEAPKFLLCHVLRFASPDSRGKLSFPVTLDPKISLPAPTPACFELRAAVLHTGVRADAGHYVALIMRTTGFFLADDAHVSSTSGPLTHSNTVYLAGYSAC